MAVFRSAGGGYDLLARSAGCVPALSAEVVAVCRRFGQPPSAETARPGLFAVWLPGGKRWAIVGVAPQGDDDRGRPGALAFHALLVTARDYRRAGANPFAFAPSLRGDWSSQTPAVLEPARCRIEPVDVRSGPAPDPKTERIVAALTHRHRVALEAPGPIDDLARAVWARLPGRVRRRASLATWAFAGENRFDLVAFPRLLGVTLDRSYLPSATLEPTDPTVPASAISPSPRTRPAHRDIRDPGSVVVAWVGLVVVALLTLAWSASRDWFRQPAPRTAARRVPARPASVATRGPFTPDEAVRVQIGLETLAARLTAFAIDPATTGPARLVARINENLHYHGRTLTDAEVATLAADPDPDKERALDWHDRIKRFLPDPDWPADVNALPLPGQLAALGRSFRLDPTTPPEAVPAALIAALSRPGVIRPTPLAARFPTLSDYARFLGKLPRADDPAGTETGQ